MLPLVALLLTGLPENLENAQKAIDTGDVDAAYAQLAQYEVLSSIARNHEQVLLGRVAQAELEKNKMVEAEVLAKDLYALAPKGKTALDILGRVALSRGNIPGAQNWAKAWAELDPEDPQLALLQAGIDAKQQHWPDVSVHTASLMADPRLNPAQQAEARDLHEKAASALAADPAAAKQVQNDEAAAVAGRERDLAANAAKWTGDDITMFCTTTNPECDRARDYFAQRGVQFIEKDIDVDEEAHTAFAKRTRSQKVPYIEFRITPGGYTTVTGFKQQEIERLLREGHREAAPDSKHAP